jgi:hypothetical protein
MAQADIIKEFLVSLGFKVDQKGLKGFTESVDGATQAVETLVKTVAGAALAMGGVVTAFAHSLDQVYFASKRVNENASDITAFGKAAKNFGVDANEAAGNIENFAAKLRNQPGFEGWLQALGINTRNNGVLRDTADLMLDMGRALEKYPQYMRSQYAAQAGMSERMMLALTDPRFGGEFSRQQGLVGNIDAAADVTRKFNAVIQDLETNIQKALLPALTSLSKAMGDDMEKASKWFIENGDKVTQTVNTFTEATINAAKVIFPILSAIGEGWSNIFSWVKATGDAINNILPSSWKDKIGEGTDWLFNKLGIGDAVYGMATGTGGGKTPTDNILNRPNTTTQADKEALVGMFMRYGWSREQASGIVANLLAESGFNPNAVGDGGKAYGIAQWHPDRQAAFAKWSGKDIRSSNLDDQVAFVNYELTNGNEAAAGRMLRASTNARQAGEVVSRYYERPLAADAEATARGSAAVQIAQTNNITVNGADDPRAVGMVVSQEQQRVNADLTRNMQTAVK